MIKYQKPRIQMSTNVSLSIYSTKMNENTVQS